MTESASSISGPLEWQPINRSIHVHEEDMVWGTFTYLKANGKNVKQRYETSAATLYFLRGTGKMAINDASVEYHDGKWFEIPRDTEDLIFPDTDTLVLTIRKPTRASIDTAENTVSARNALHTT